MKIACYPNIAVRRLEDNKLRFFTSEPISDVYVGYLDAEAGDLPHDVSPEVKQLLLDIRRLPGHTGLTLGCKQLTVRIVDIKGHPRAAAEHEVASALLRRFGLSEHDTEIEPIHTDAEEGAWIVRQTVYTD
jgi:hypothetical protein